jgi:hypothetical protein
VWSARSFCSWRRNLIYECDMISKIEFVVPTLPNYIFLFDKRLPNYIIYFLLYVSKLG